jgi:hypothetical protein
MMFRPFLSVQPKKSTACTDPFIEKRFPFRMRVGYLQNDWFGLEKSL